MSHITPKRAVRCVPYPHIPHALIRIFYGVTIKMKYEFDPNKNASNIAKHGVPLTAVDGFEWGTADIREDHRFDYPEQRFEATGLIGEHVYIVVYCLRDDVTRVISARRAEKWEVRRYVRYLEKR